MSIGFQKVIRFVPFINFFVTIFSLIKTYLNSKHARVVDIFKFVIVTFIAMLLVNVPQIILSYVFENVIIKVIFSYISAYATLFVISSIAIFQQEKYIESDNN